MSGFVVKRVKIRKAGARAVLKAPGVLDDLRGRAGRIAAAANSGVAWPPEDGYSPTAQQGQNRARASVITAGPKAMAEESRNRRLLHALDSGRGG